MQRSRPAWSSLQPTPTVRLPVTVATVEMRAVTLLAGADSGALAATSHSYASGSLALPAASIWRTRSVCLPFARSPYSISDVHGANVAPSSEHSSVVPGSTPM